MKIYKDVGLKDFNTFAINSIAKLLIIVENIEDLEILNKKYKKFIVLGGGSNILFSKKIIDIPVIKLNLFDIRINNNLVVVQAGVLWNNFVKWSIKNNYYGLENLAGIPGSVGGAIVQNIGAYGVEISEFIYNVKVFDREKGEIKIFSNEQCKYSYRNSIFKGNSRFVVLEASFRLNDFKRSKYIPNVNHKQVYNFILEKKKQKKRLTPYSVYKYIINLRRQKLPDFNIVHNAGSFFKNPMIKLKDFNKLKKMFPDIPGFIVKDKSVNKVKVPAGWLIEKVGFKGYRFENTDAVVSQKHALVLVNYGNANGKDILALANLIQNKIYAKFGIMLEKEVVVV